MVVGLSSSKDAFGRALMANSLLNSAETLPNGFPERNDSLLIL
jgi:hypothetical protein